MDNGRGRSERIDKNSGGRVSSSSAKTITEPSDSDRSWNYFSGFGFPQSFSQSLPSQETAGYFDQAACFGSAVDTSQLPSPLVTCPERTIQHHNVVGSNQGTIVQDRKRRCEMDDFTDKFLDTSSADHEVPSFDNLFATPTQSEPDQSTTPLKRQYTSPPKLSGLDQSQHIAHLGQISFEQSHRQLSMPVGSNGQRHLAQCIRAVNPPPATNRTPLRRFRLVATIVPRQHTVQSPGGIASVSRQITPRVTSLTLPRLITQSKTPALTLSRIVPGTAVCGSSMQRMPARRSINGGVAISISNVVATFNIKCSLDLRSIAMQMWNVEYKRETNRLVYRLRKPLGHANIWASGKITCCGTTSEKDARMLARRVARCIQKLGLDVHFCSYRVVNVFSNANLPFTVDLVKLHDKVKFEHRVTYFSYEPEIHPGATIRIGTLSTTMKVHTTGAMTIIGPSSPNLHAACSQVYPLLQSCKRSNIHRSAD